MRITKVCLRQSGGFAGLIRTSELPAAELTADERASLTRAMNAPRSAPPAAAATAARDTLCYEFDVETDAGPRRLTFDELNLPDSLSTLVERLSARAKPGHL